MSAFTRRRVDDPDQTQARRGAPSAVTVAEDLLPYGGSSITRRSGARASSRRATKQIDSRCRS